MHKQTGVTPPGRIPPSKSTFKDKTWVNASRTLYVTNIPGGTSTGELQKIFGHLDGFVALRRVRNMCFVDFAEKQAATKAMWHTNGHKMSPQHDKGLLLSYDKDDKEESGGWSVRKREEEKAKRREAEETRVPYRCSACSHFCLKLARPLSELPERRTDGSRVVEFSTELVSLTCVKGGVKLLKREKGVEKQFRFSCELCDSCVAYQSTPYDTPPKFLYVLPKAVTSVRDGDVPSIIARDESATDAKINGHEPLSSSTQPLLPPPPPLPPPASSPSSRGQPVATTQQETPATAAAAPARPPLPCEAAATAPLRAAPAAAPSGPSIPAAPSAAAASLSAAPPAAAAEVPDPDSRI